jgi:cystathionine beta-lyase
MSAFDFDAPPDRRGGDSLKWAKYRDRDILPMWVADMDFVSPPAVMQALHARVDHGVFGYGAPPASLTEALIEYLQRAHNWKIDAGWIIWLPGLVTGLNVVCRAVGDCGDGVLTGTPIYPPFLSAPVNSERETIEVPLVLDGQRWRWDLDRAQAEITPRSRLLLLCNPHNPMGRAFDEAELMELARFAERNNLIVCADEIHSDLVLDPACRHLPFAGLSEEIARRTVTLMAPSKTFNIAGLGCAFAVVPDATLRKRLRAAMNGIVPYVNLLGFVAAEAAYREGEPWRQALIAYLRTNAQAVAGAVADMPGLSTTPVEATYLAWIDARALGRKNVHALFEQAGVGLSDGADFAAPGYVRLNFGCPRARLMDALARMRLAVESIA